MTIKPGTLCLLLSDGDYRGRHVYAVKYEPHDYFMTPDGLVFSDAWEVAAPWITGDMPRYARPSHLVPLSDPDAIGEVGEVGEQNDELLQRVRSVRRAVAAKPDRGRASPGWICR